MEKATENPNSGETVSVENDRPVNSIPNDKDKSKNMAIFRKIAVVLAVLIAILLLVNFIYSFFNSRVSDIAAAQASLRAQSNMVFVEQVYRRLFLVRNSTTTRGPFGGNRADNDLLFTVNYKLRAGIDLNDLELKEKDGFLLVSYSKPQVFSVDVDYKTLNLIFGQRYSKFFNPNYIQTSHYLPIINGGIYGLPVLEENDRVVHEEIVPIKDIAIQNGIEQTVKNNAEWWFTNYLNILGFSNITFEVKP